MIWHEKFVVCSIPRTGTDIKSYLAGGIQGIEGSARWDHAKHSPLNVKWCEGMIAVLTFRRLVLWLLSYVGMGCEDGLHPSWRKLSWPSDDELFDDAFGRLWLGAKPGLVQTRRGEDCLQGPIATLPDRYLDYMTNSGGISVDRYLRSEHIYVDILQFLRDMEVSFDERRVKDRSRGYHPLKGKLSYVKDPLHYWSEGTLARLEAANPGWMGIQETLYDLG